MPVNAFEDDDEYDRQGVQRSKKTQESANKWVVRALAYSSVMLAALLS